MLVSDNPDWLRNHLIYFTQFREYQLQEKPDTPIGPLVDSYIKNELSMEDGMKQYFDSVTEIHKRNDRILRAVKKVKGRSFYNHLVGFIESSETQDWQQWEIVREPVGDHQTENEFGRAIKEVWVDQGGGGMTGDDYHGTVCIPIKSGRWLKIFY